MSGDVQPRKRGKDNKSKRRRAEDSEAKAAEQLARKMSTLNDGEDEDAPVKVSGVQSANMGPDDYLLHVQKDDHGTGGHWCAKIFFFSLMAILVGLVGLILLENRGISDLDTPLSESRYAEYLGGWVEEKRESHDEHDILESLDELDDHDHDHDEPYAEEDDHDETSESHDEEHDEDDHDEEHDDDDHDEEEDGHDDNDEEEQDGDADEDEDADSKASPEDPDGDDEDVMNRSPEVDDDDDDDQADAGGDDENDSAPEKDAATEVDSQENDEDNDDQDAGDDDDDSDDKDSAKSNEVEDAGDDNKSGENNSNIAADPNDSDPFDEEDDDDASFEEVIDNDEGEDIHLQKLAHKEDPAAAGEADGDDDQPEESSSGEAAEDECVTETQPEPLLTAYNRRMTLVSKEEPLPDDADEEEGLKRYQQARNDALEIELQRANEQLAENTESALKRFNTILATNGSDLVAQYGRAKALDDLAASRKDNRLLRQSIAAHERLVLQLGEGLPDHVFRAMGDRCVELMRFIGLTLRAVTVHNKMIERFPDEPLVYNQLAVSYLMGNKLDDAKIILHNTLLRWRDDGYALVHYGFVLKNLDNDLDGAVKYLTEGIKSKANGTLDGRFFFALGDSLQRLGRVNAARRVYKYGTQLKLFRSEFQRSLYNVDRLQSQPFWSKEETNVAAQLDALVTNWRRVRDEGLAVLGEDGYFIDETENLRDRGHWQQFELFSRGQRVAGHCEKTPFTCKLIDTFTAARHCTRGQVKFSVMHPGTHVWPHCGPTNCRLRAHLGLHVPSDTFLRVAEETRSWREGELLIFDDSFEHEVWHNGTSVRLVLIVDIWHPDLTTHERETLPPL